jgi:hypothetical protein
MKNYIVYYSFGGRSNRIFETEANSPEEAIQNLYKARFPRLGKRKSSIAPPLINKVLETETYE